MISPINPMTTDVDNGTAHPGAARNRGLKNLVHLRYITFFLENLVMRHNSKSRSVRP